MKYPKINTCFKRDVDNLIMPECTFSDTSFTYLKDNKWEATEKINGTNIRIEFSTYFDIIENKHNSILNIKGHTDKAIIPTHLQKKLDTLFNKDFIIEAFDLSPDVIIEITLFGEGYGVKIQNGDNYIIDDVDFILFDIAINNIWLDRNSIECIATKLNIKVVPLLGYYTLQEAIDITKNGFVSKIAQNKNYLAEGMILKSIYGLLNKNGNRIITKLKTSDFNKLKNKYGGFYNPNTIGRTV